MSSRAMVGRAAELATVRGLVDAAAASSGTAVMVVGAAGRSAGPRAGRRHRLGPHLATCCVGPVRRPAGDAGRPRSRRACALGVTSREADVLALVTQGLTNAQIAQRLFLSPRTVETHVASLLAKTGATTRGELGSRAAMQSP